MMYTNLYQRLTHLFLYEEESGGGEAAPASEPENTNPEPPVGSSQNEGSGAQAGGGSDSGNSGSSSSSSGSGSSGGNTESSGSTGGGSQPSGGGSSQPSGGGGSADSGTQSSGGSQPSGGGSDSGNSGGGSSSSGSESAGGGSQPSGGGSGADNGAQDGGSGGADSGNQSGGAGSADSGNQSGGSSSDGGSGGNSGGNGGNSGGNGGNSGGQKPPNNNNGNQKPPSNNGGNQKPPANNGGNQKPPANNGGNQKPPSNHNGGQTSPANNGGNTQPQVTEEPDQVLQDDEDAFSSQSVWGTTVAVVKDEPNDRGGDGGATGLLIGAGVIIVLLLAAVIVLLLKRGKPAKAKAAPAPIPDDEETQRTDNLDMVAAAPVSKGIMVGAGQNIGRRSDQQDSFGVTPLAEIPRRGLLAMVADGMGGMSDGAAISQMAVRTILNGFMGLQVASNPPLQLTRLACAAHQAVRSMPSAGSGGSTLVMAYVVNDRLFTLSIGDSRIYLLRDHLLMQLNREHNYAVDLDEKAAKGEISFEEAMNDPQRKALTSYLGIGDLQKFDRMVQPLPLKDGDRIALMSDGVFGTLSDEELQTLLELPAQRAADEIVQAVMRKNKPRQDNMTVIVVEYH